MPRSRSTAQRLAALFIAGVLLLNYPLLSLFNHPGELWGIPTLYVYLFAVWGALIGLMARAAETGDR